jgi:hypothetical protein
MKRRLTLMQSDLRQEVLDSDDGIVQVFPGGGVCLNQIGEKVLRWQTSHHKGWYPTGAWLNLGEFRSMVREIRSQLASAGILGDAAKRVAAFLAIYLAAEEAEPRFFDAEELLQDWAWLVPLVRDLGPKRDAPRTVGAADRSSPESRGHRRRRERTAPGGSQNTRPGVREHSDADSQGPQRKA